MPNCKCVNEIERLTRSTKAAIADRGLAENYPETELALSCLTLCSLCCPAPALRIGNSLACFGTKYPLDTFLCLRRRLSSLRLRLSTGLAFNNGDLGLYLASRRKKITYLVKSRNLRIKLSDDIFNCHRPQNIPFLWISRYALAQIQKPFHFDLSWIPVEASM